MKNYIFLYICAFFASFGALLAGYDTGIISAALLYIEESFKITPDISALLVSSVSLGAIFGALINGFIADKIGRSKTIIISALTFLFASLLCFLSISIKMLIFSRFLIGCAVGVVSFIIPLYLSEISPKEKRGQIVSFYQLAITFGILSSYFTGYFASGCTNNWRIMFLIGAIPALILLFSTIFLKDTPRWYIMAGKIDMAKKILEKIDRSQNIELEIENIKNTLYKNEKIKFEKRIVKPFFIGIGIMFSQIATGINAIIYYAPTIFKSAGFEDNKEALFLTVFIGLINFLMTFIAYFFVDKIGRKPLLYTGLFGMLLNLLILAFILNLSSEIAFIRYIAVISTGLYIVFFSMSLGPVALLIIAEIFPLKYRSNAMSIAIISNFIFNFITVGSFPIICARYGASCIFLIFALICILSLIFIKKVVPETRGMSLEEIEKQV